MGSAGRSRRRHERHFGDVALPQISQPFHSHQKQSMPVGTTAADKANLAQKAFGFFGP